MRLVLRLSQSAPGPWSEYFNQRWAGHIYGMKRRATVVGDKLEIICMSYELQSDHLPELNNVIAETNEEYKKYVADRDRARRIEEERANYQKQELSDLKGRLKFD